MTKNEQDLEYVQNSLIPMCDSLQALCNMVMLHNQAHAATGSALVCVQ